MTGTEDWFDRLVAYVRAMQAGRAQRYRDQVEAARTRREEQLVQPRSVVLTTIKVVLTLAVMAILALLTLLYGWAWLNGFTG